MRLERVHPLRFQILKLKYMAEQTQEIPEKPIRPEVVSEAPPKKKCSRIILLVVLGLIVVAGAVYAGIQIGRKQGTPSQQISQPPVPTSIPTQVPEITNIPIPGDTADWKIYRNGEYGFEFKYPLRIVESKPSKEDPRKELSVYISEDDSDPPRLLGLDLYLYDLKEIGYKGVGSFFGPPNSPIVTQQEVAGKINIGGKEAELVLAPYGECGGTSCSGSFIAAVLKEGDFLYVFRTYRTYAGEVGSGFNSLENQILSTFKFLNQKETKFVCPQNGWENCMPILSEEGKLACSKEAETWYKANCPNFKGLAR